MYYYGGALWAVALTGAVYWEKHFVYPTAINNLSSWPKYFGWQSMPLLVTHVSGTRLASHTQSHVRRGAEHTKAVYYCEET